MDADCKHASADEVARQPAGSSLSMVTVAAVFACALVVRLFALKEIEHVLPPNILFWAFSLGNVQLLDQVRDAGGGLSASTAVAGARAWLFRSGSPAVYSSIFAAARAEPVIDVRSFKTRLQAAAPDIPVESVEVVDVSLLGGPHLERENFMVRVEEQFFVDHPDEGLFRHMPMPGLLPEFMESACAAAGVAHAQCPIETRQLRDLAKADRERLVEGFAQWDPNGVAKRVELLHSMLHNVSGERPRAIVFHCQCGCDRTGMLAAAYDMTYKGKTFQTAMDENVAIAGRPMYYPYQVGLQWYCEWLKAAGRYAGDTSGDACGHCNRPGMVCAPEPLRADKWIVKWADMAVALSASALAFVLFQQWRARWCRQLCIGLSAAQNQWFDDHTDMSHPPESPPQRSDFRKYEQLYSVSPRSPETPDPPILGGRWLSGMRPAAPLHVVPLPQILAAGVTVPSVSKAMQGLGPTWVQKGSASEPLLAHD